MIYSNAIVPVLMDPGITGRGSLPFLTEIVKGDYYIIKKDGEHWPIFICDEEIVVRFFNQRPANARQNNGNWHEDYKIGGKHADKRCYPTMIPGTFSPCWVGFNVLEAFDSGMGLAIQMTTTNIALAIAWKQAIKAEEESRDIEYWKAQLVAQKSNQSRNDSKSRKSVDNRKRKGMTNFSMPGKSAMMNFSDDEEPLETGNKSIKVEASSLSPSDEAALYEDPESDVKRHKLDTTGRFSVSFAGQHTDHEGHNRPVTSTVPSSVSSQDPKCEQITIYVDDPFRKFQIIRSAIDTSPFLSKRVSGSQEEGWYLMAPVLTSIKVEDFRPVTDYLERREYVPQLLDDGTDWVRFEWQLTPSEGDKEVVRCATIYRTAQDLELPGLQDLAFRKLKALGKFDPYTALPFLNVVELIFGRADGDVREYLATYLAEHFWEIMMKEAKTLADIMQRDRELHQAVFRLMSGLPMTEVRSAKIEDLEDGAGVKEEKEGTNLGDMTDVKEGDQGKDKETLDGDQEMANSTESEVVDSVNE